MAFRFSLAAVLKYRQALEQRELTALERAQAEIALRENQIHEAEADLCRLEQHRGVELRQGMPSIHLQDAIAQEHALSSLQKELTKKQEELKIKRQQLLKIYQEARQKRELLERLRERRLGQYTRAQMKAEQATLDDLFLARRKQSQ